MKILDVIKQDKVWGWFISYAYKMKYDYCHLFENNYVFVFTYGGYRVIIWTHGNVPYATIHIKDYSTEESKVEGCVLSSYNLEKSRELARILLNRLKVANLAKSLIA